MSILGWIIIGFFAGWLASIITATSKRLGCCMDVVIGILGAFIGGFIFSYLQKKQVTFEFNLWSLFVAFVGAVVLLVILKIIARLIAGPEKA